MNSKSILLLCMLVLPILCNSFLSHERRHHHTNYHGASKNFKKIAYVNGISNWYGPGILDSFGINSPCYDIIILCFWMPSYVSDALGIWQNIHSNIGSNDFGSTNAEVQKYILDQFHKNGKQLFISAFGATGNPSGDPVQVAEQLAEFINQNPYIDGVDIDYEDNDAVMKGPGADYIIAFQKALSEKVHNKNIIFTHAPQAPYFSRTVYKDKGYYQVEKEIGHLIAWYNVQFYNQVEDTYDTYETLFIESPEPFVETAYKQIIDLAGVPLHKLVLGKPATPADASNTGYINPTSLGKICTEAREKLGYELPGFFIWQYKNDAKCEFADAFLKSYFPAVY
ncbi:glycoside hydrolase family 18 protein (macronuclear) [Tetrahymena thermophila SB210]|uniref:Glycoside hydrolase family 18 protein n=1 Tax=Tetrahymena thermophila (strain SB210) TaxID=312017 RepID=I7M7N6_TETTS|nr:glycoside hydrolase family 18 protein [Tetrahymena thermophila SB210]EAR94987.1 glycoside hydrolase family 18 protein [Tetrahymena thermophila SB210]|eukprot:XP_001015232.1 glycoside hydrolase family 18 protein [Tetrahymena thermophila SB210]